MSSCTQTIMAATVAVVLSACPVSSCMIGYPLDPGNFAKAHVLLRAKVLAYTADKDLGSARFDLETIENLSLIGRSVKVWKGVLWSNPTYAVPATWTMPTVIIGLEATIDMTGEPIVIVTQEGCSAAQILRDSPRNRDRVMKAVMDRRRAIAEIERIGRDRAWKNTFSK